MTLVASWFNFEPNTKPSIWTAADTQISDGVNTLMLEGAKIFELPIICKHLHSPSQSVYHRSSLGFAYAGSSITALNTYATLSSILCNLGSGQPHLPDYESIVQKTFDILKLYLKDDEPNRNAEISIWGFCPKTKQSFIGVVNKFDIKIILADQDDLKWVLLGYSEAKNLLNSKIEEKIKDFHDIKNYKYWRIPIYPLREIIETHIFENQIGGNIQLAQLDQYQYQHLAISQRIKGTDNKGRMVYRNLDIKEDFGDTVGDCFIAINGYNLDLE